MNNSTQQQAIDALITLWEDIYFVQGKGLVACQLRPHIGCALAEPASYIHRVIDANPAPAEWLVAYARHPVELRRKIIGRTLSQKAVQEAAWLLERGIYYLAMGCLSEGITAAEAERRINQQYEDALTTVTLKELIQTDDSVAYDNELQRLMGSLRLSTGSIAGADKRLGTVLSQRLNTSVGDMSLYEQDLKVALWECARGNHHLIRETVRMIEGDPPRPLDEQISLLVCVFRGQESKLMRATLLRILRKTIADLPDIRSDIAEIRRQEAVPGMVFVRDEALLESIADQEGFGHSSRIDSLLSQLKPHELDLYHSELERLQKNVTRSQWYGEAKAEKVKQQLKYLRRKLKWTPSLGQDTGNTKSGSSCPQGVWC